MGGNASVIINGEVVAQAVKLDLNIVSRPWLTNRVSKILHDLNTKFFGATGEYLFENPSFVGSSTHLFDDNISDDEFVAHKPTIGDIDVQIDPRFKAALSEFLVPGLKVYDSTYLGRSDNSLNQLNCIFEIDGLPIQIDFWFAEDGGWSKFSHSANWEDIKLGIKGVFHKYLLGSIDFAFPMGEITVLTRKTKKPKQVFAHPFAFSVDYGVRKKYESDGEGHYFEIEPANATYERRQLEIIDMLFRCKHQIGDLEKLQSFVGIVKLMDKYLTAEQIKLVQDEFFARCFGKNAQQLERDDPAADRSCKMIALKFLQAEIDEAQVERYYETYRSMDDRMKKSQGI